MRRIISYSTRMYRNSCTKTNSLTKYRRKTCSFTFISDVEDDVSFYFLLAINFSE
jgi:hypothetical protein